MKAHSSSTIRTGFTLIEVLASLGLCALLATATASAISFASRAERAADRRGEASLFLPSLYAAQRLRPGDLPVAPRGWGVARASKIVSNPDESLREWHILEVTPAGREIPPVILRVLEDEP